MMATLKQHLPKSLQPTYCKDFLYNRQKILQNNLKINIQMWNTIRLFFLLSIISIFSENYCFAASITSKETNNSDSTLILVYSDLSQYYQHINVDSSILFLKKILQIAKKNDLKSIEAKTLAKYGNSLYIRGDYEMALDYFMMSLKKYKDLNDKTGIAVGYNNIGLIYNIQDRPKKAIKHHKKSIDLCTILNDSSLLATNYFNIGISFHQEKILDSAIIYANKSIIINKNINKEVNNYRIYNLKGRIYTESNNFNNAKEMFQLIIDANNINNIWELSYAHDGLANLYFSNKDYKKSIHHGFISFQMAKRVNAKFDIQTSAETLSKSFAKINKYDSAFKYLTISNLYNDSLFNKVKQSHINYVELKNVKHENEQLTKDKEIHLRQIESNNKILTTSIIGTIILIILIFIIIYNHSRKNTLNKLLKKQNHEIELKNKELKRINSSKDLIFRIIAHDLMAPISTVVSFTDLMISRFNSLNKEETFDIMKTLNDSTNQAYNLIENLLNWSRSQFISSKINLQETNILKIVKNISILFEIAIETKKINFFINIDSKLHTETDQNMLSAVIRNILANAIKFTPKEGSISLSAINTENKIEIIIADSGIGINKATIIQLFDKKPSTSTIGTDGEKGSGLGLMLCKEFIDRLGGEIWAESMPGQGSQFHFTIPKI